MFRSAGVFFICYSVGSIIFSIVVILSLFSIISPRSMFDKILVSVFVLAALIVFWFFFEFFISIGMRDIAKLIFIFIGWICIIVKIALLLLNDPFSVSCLLLSVLQLLVVAAYFILC